MEQQKPYKISKVAGAPRFDSVPVAKIINYPLEQRDYKPFAQCILCLGGDRLFLRLWAFEVSPAPTSALHCVLYCFPQHPELAFHAAFIHQEGDTVKVQGGLLENGTDQPLDKPLRSLLSDTVDLHPHNGEDLQGAYWGMTLSLPLSTLEALAGPTALVPGSSFPGNFYKICEDTRFAHMGCLFPARFPDAPFAPDSMGKFEVVSY